MPVKSLIIPLEPGGYYHVFNRGNNRELIFDSIEDYNFFLDRYNFYLKEYVETYAYCLMKNHFHFLIQVKEMNEGGKSSVSNQFRKLFICYSRRYNHRKKRTGCLLARNFRRIEIENGFQLKNVVLYIHFNPVHHKCSNSINHHQFSSYREFLELKPALVNKQKVLEWFDGMEQFLLQHNHIDILGVKDQTMDEE